MVASIDLFLYECWMVIFIAVCWVSLQGLQKGFLFFWSRRSLKLAFARIPLYQYAVVVAEKVEVLVV